MKIITGIVALSLISFLSVGQTTDIIANEAFITIRMVIKFHAAPRELNAAYSANVFDGMLQKADPDRVLFTKNDISRLCVYRAVLSDEIKNRKTGYLNLFIKLYRTRLLQADSLISVLNKKPIDFYTAEKLTAAEDTTYPVSLPAQQQKLNKILKAGVLDELTDNLKGDFKLFTAARQKQYADSALTVLQKKWVASFHRKIDDILQGATGIVTYIGNLYCETIALCFDPHTEFFPPEEKERFDTELGKQPFLFGFSIEPDKKGGVLINNLQPGSPAFKSGKLNKGDKFISMQWQGKQVTDVSDLSLREFNALLDQSNHQRVLFTLKKADGSVIQVSLQREQAEGDADDRVKSFVLKGASNIGYIYLPAFYEDWVSSHAGLNGCANDVGREIIKLKKENISGLILDVRYNGGGSVREATELAGIFIDAGPVAQEKGRDEKVNTLKDIDRGTIYDGPLVILVNGYSASASELLAGTLQDYNRAVIVGSPTYGKATMQVVLPMDTTVAPETLKKKATENNLKVTIGKLYRVNGSSAQLTGVTPDILLPDILDAYVTKEADGPFALKPSTIAPNKYYTPYPPLPVKYLAQNVQAIIDTGKYFNAVKKLIALAKQQKSAKDISLSIKNALAEKAPNGNEVDKALLQTSPSKQFTVQNNQYEKLRLQADENLKELNEEFSKQVAGDAAINVAYMVLQNFKP